VEPRVTLITLGVADVGRARAFYERLGWKAGGPSNPDVAFFQAGPLVLALWGRDALAADAGIAAGPEGFRATALAYNTRSKGEVAEVAAAWAAAGGRTVKPPHDTFWGGHSAYVADPDGHLWEIAWNPHWELTAEGALRLPG
jgi:catechol 2,3-dioxygenase-like lactoylglutathione lyase family enzyme